jgi:type I restriction enzyme S subunit
VINGLTYCPEDIHEKGVLVLRSSNVQNRRLAFKDNVYVNVEEGKFNPVQENDILICVRNGSQDLIGKNAIINKANEGVAFGAFMTVYRSKYNPFFFHLFDTPIYNKEVYKNLGATINSINGSDLKKFKMPFPSIEEQNKITALLDSMDKEVASLSEELESLKLQKKGLMQQLLTGKVRVKA